MLDENRNLVIKGSYEYDENKFHIWSEYGDSPCLFISYPKDESQEMSLVLNTNIYIEPSDFVEKMSKFLNQVKKLIEMDKE